MKTIFLNNASSLKSTVAVLKSGGLVIYPTDTVYGAIVDAKNEDAVRKLIEFKNRPPGKPISVFVSDLAMAKQHVYINPAKDAVISEMLPGPYTLVVPSRHTVSPLLESEDNTLGFRIPAYSPVLELVTMFNGPLSATSANLAGRSPHYSIASLMATLPAQKQKLIDLVVDAGELPRHKPSTVVDLTEKTIKTIRVGDLPFASETTVITNSVSETAQVAVGLFERYKDTHKSLAFVLQGELGVGKTVFVQAIAHKLGVDNVISPTFTVYYEYDIPPKYLYNEYKKIYHYDLYQIENESEFQNIVDVNYFIQKNILFFEWGEKAAHLLPTMTKHVDVVYVTIEHLSPTSRKITSRT